MEGGGVAADRGGRGGRRRVSSPLLLPHLFSPPGGSLGVSGTATGDYLVWNATAADWVAAGDPVYLGSGAAAAAAGNVAVGAVRPAATGWSALRVRVRGGRGRVRAAAAAMRPCFPFPAPRRAHTSHPPLPLSELGRDRRVFDFDREVVERHGS